MHGPRHLRDASGVIGDRPEVVHRQHVDRGGEHAHRRHRGPEEARGARRRGRVPGRRPDAGRPPQVVGRDDRDAHREHRRDDALQPHREARDDGRRVARRRRLGDAADGLEGVVRVVARRAHAHEGRPEAAQPAAQEVAPRGGRALDVQEPEAREAEPGQRDGERHQVALLQHDHGRVLALPPLEGDDPLLGHGEHAQRRRDDVDRVHDEPAGTGDAAALKDGVGLPH